ncbi:MAG TPA: phosphatidate cytidylyltransferase [Candidatus Limnocylindria bacterium]|nr:phosphatidate cytidylyltransferase [Candidatus Limnocylindria bacterium]
MGDLGRRTVTAAVYGAVVLVAIVAPPVVFWVALAIVALLGIAEVARLHAGARGLILGAVFVAGLASLGILRAAGSTGAHHALAGELPVWLLLVLVPTWAADIGAYLVGSTLGRRKLAPRISPGKTWEGTIAGLVLCGLAAFGVGATFGLGRAMVAAVAVLLGIVGLGGDLFESSVKRHAGVKDSGTLLPGHGGVLDRLDSTVTGAIFVAGVFFLGAASGLG